MISQGFPLWALDEDGVAYAVIGWTDADPRKYPVMVTLGTLGLPVAAEEGPGTGLIRFTTTDPTERGERYVMEPDPISTASDTEIRAMLERIALRLLQLGATGPARGIRAVLDDDPTRPDTLRARMAALADEMDAAPSLYGVANNAGRLIRSELDK